MKQIYDEMIFRLHLPPEETVGLRVTIFAFRGVVIEGYKGILRISAEEIRLRINKSVLVVSGKNLAVAEASSDEIFIRGDITAIGVDNG